MSILVYTEEQGRLSSRQWERGYRIVSIMLKPEQAQRVRDILKPSMPCLGIKFPYVRVRDGKHLEILWDIHHSGPTIGAVQAVEHVLNELAQAPTQATLFSCSEGAEREVKTHELRT